MNVRVRTPEFSFQVNELRLGTVVSAVNALVLRAADEATGVTGFRLLSVANDEEKEIYDAESAVKRGGMALILLQSSALIAMV